jgi:CrcB protein
VEGIQTVLKYVMIGAGGFAGSIARYLIGNYVAGRFGFRFPYGTLLVNLSGSFVLGVAMALLARTTANPYWRYLVPIGFIGAYTTFSTFEYETLRAIQDGQLAIGLLNVAVSVTTGFAAVWLGDLVGKAFV